MGIFDLFKRKSKISNVYKCSNQSSGTEIDRQKIKDCNNYGVNKRDYIINTPFTPDYISELV